MTVTKKLAEMSNGTVQLLSLVEAGASGAPFKRLKSAETEGDIDVFTPEKSKATPDQPRLIALAVSKDGDVAAAREIAKAAGVEFGDERVVEGTTLLLVREDDRVNTLDPQQIQIQLDDELAAICKVEKSFIQFTGTTSFSEAIKSQGFFPQLSNALEVFGGVAYQILEGAENPGAAATEIQKAGEEFTALVSSMTKALPKETFKMAETIKTLKADGAEEAAETTEEGAEEATETEEGAEATAEKETSEEATETGGEGDGAGAAATDEAAETEETVEKDDEASEEDTEEGAEKETETEEAAGDSELSQVLKAIEGLTATVTAQGEAQADLKEQVEAVAKKADEAAETAEETSTAVKGRVTTSAAPDGRAKGEASVSKGAPPLADTGMDSLHKK